MDINYNKELHSKLLQKEWNNVWKRNDYTMHFIEK